jgi:hypothetical protein
MTSTRRAVLRTGAATLAAWAVVWAVASAAGWQPRPILLLAAFVLAAGLASLASRVASDTAPLPRVQVRATPTSPVGEDQRLVRHQLQLEDAAGDPPSCRPVLTRITELTHDRLRRLEEAGQRSRDAPVPPRLAALLEERPPDRTRLSHLELTRLVDDLEALGAEPSETVPERPGEDPRTS